MSTGDSILLLGLIVLALGLTGVSIKIKLLPYSLASMIAWIALAIGFVTGDIGPGFGTLWVEAIAILFVLLSFAPLITQAVEDVHHETEFGGQKISWTSIKVKGWSPGDGDPYGQRRAEMRQLVGKRRTKKKPSEDRW